MKLLRFGGLILACVLLLAAGLQAQPSFAQAAPCGSAGGPACTPVPPNDRDSDSVPDANDACPDQGGDVGNQGCPLPAGQPTSEPNRDAVNTNRPDPNGTCSLTTYGTVPVNVRELPEPNAAAVGMLDPALLYPVLGAIYSEFGLWYRVEAGWVASFVVVVDGDCAFGDIEIVPGTFTLDAAAVDAARNGIGVDQECTTLPNGTRWCWFELTATADDGDGTTEGHVNIPTCGFGPAGVVCVSNEFVIPEEPDCPPEFCEPVPSDSGDPGYDPGNPAGDPDAAPMCEDVINDLVAQGQASLIVEQGDRFSIAFDGQPPVPPTPCRLVVLVPHADQSAGGRIPVTVLNLNTSFPPPAGAQVDYLLTIEGVPGESQAPQPTSVPTPRPSGCCRGGSSTIVIRIDVMMQDDTGVVCFAAVPGNFAACGGE